ncbi:MAG: DUF2075 domain-containing protein [Planctomycetes bacterium]|nr:DUF2075 domain-containing protein [Planctomycetota bacterium]
MSEAIQIDINDLPFSQEGVATLSPDNKWPIIYLLHGDKKTAYVGESINVKNRLGDHLRTKGGKGLRAVHVINSKSFNMSVTKEVESKLIKYLGSDGQYEMLNRNDGLVDHQYYQQEIYETVFDSIWDKLREKGLAVQSKKDIDNSDLFKYSPYKSLTREQKECVGNILISLANGKTKSLMVQGGAGTGKTVLAVYLFKLLASPIAKLRYEEFGLDEATHKMLVKKWGEKPPSMALVIAMTSLRGTLKAVFKQIDGLKQKMVIGPGELGKNEYDIVMVDEAHRLRRRKNIPNYGSFDKTNKLLGFGKDGTELDWVVKRSKQRILFYDPCQSVRPSDVLAKDFEDLRTRTSSHSLELEQQMRCGGGVGFQDAVHRILNATEVSSAPLPYGGESKFEFFLFESPVDLIESIRAKDEEYGLCRTVAGYAWKWTKKDKDAEDVELGGNTYKWNGTNKDWVNSENSSNEIGCIHTVQGYDLNYVGVIFGKEITYNWQSNEIEIVKDNYHDGNGKKATSDEELKAYVVNIYKTILLRGMKGVYVYACDEDMQRYLRGHVLLYAGTE